MANFRNPYVTPFSVNSLWNTPIGSGAAYVAANLPATPSSGAGCPSVDREPIILSPTSPLTPVYLSSGGWGGDRCATSGGVQQTIPIPNNFVVPSDNKNECSAALMSDYRTLKQAVAFSRCTSSGIATCFEAFPDVDLYSTGEAGSHGGSDLSAIGGSLRLGELRPGQTIGPTHALKLNLDESVLYNGANGSGGYRWPATKKDSYSYNGTNSALKIGALLAIPPSVNLAANQLGLSTAPAKLLAWTLQNYGAYVVDSFNANQNVYQICAENNAVTNESWETQFTNDWGYGPIQWGGVASSGTAWSNDFGKLMAALQVVNNNAQNNVGGGGTPRQALVDPLSGTFSAEAHNFANGVTSLVINVPAHADGDLLFANIGYTGTATLTPPSGWQLISASGTTTKQNTYRKMAAGEPASYTWTTDVSADINGFIWDLKDVDPNSPVHVVSTNSGSGTTITANSATTSLNNTLLVYAAVNHSAATAWNPNTFWTQRNGVGPSSNIQTIGNTASLYDKVVTGNFVTTTSGGSSGDTWSSQLIAFAPNTGSSINATPSITGVAGVSSVGAPGLSVAAGSVAGVTGAGDAGSFMNLEQLDGVTGSGQVGVFTFSETSSTLISGVGASISVGELSDSLSTSSLSGASGISSAGALDGVSVGGVIFSVTASALPGNISTAVLTSFVISGVAGIGSAGTISAARTSFVSGVSGNAVTGNISHAVGANTSGVSAIGAVGFVPSAKNIFGVSASGIASATIAVGSASTTSVLGVFATSGTGVLSESLSEAFGIVGSSALSSVGSLAALIGAEYHPLGVNGIGLVGDLKNATSGFVLGVGCAGVSGDIGAKVDASPSMDGVFATFAIGALGIYNPYLLSGISGAGYAQPLSVYKETPLTIAGVFAECLTSDIGLLNSVVSIGVEGDGFVGDLSEHLEITTNSQLGGVAGNSFVSSLESAALVVPSPLSGVFATGFAGSGPFTPYIEASAPAFIIIGDFALYKITIQDAA